MASSALKKAMLPPAVTTTRLCGGRRAMPFSAASLRLEPVDQLGDALDALVFVVLRVGQEAGDALDRLARRAVVHDPLAQRNRAGMLANQLADDRNDRPLHGLHARGNGVRQCEGSALRGEGLACPDDSVLAPRR